MSYASDVDQALRAGVIAMVDNCIDPEAVTPGLAAQNTLFTLFNDEAVIREIHTELLDNPVATDLGYLEIGLVLDALATVLRGGDG